jgi:hypothetical protein
LGLKKNQVKNLTKINSELSLQIEHMTAEFSEVDSSYYFRKKTDEYLIAGKVKILEQNVTADVSIDSLEIPVELELVVLQYNEDGTAETIVKSSNKFLKVQNIKTMIQVPETPIEGPDNFGVLGGVTVNLEDNTPGALIGLRWKKYGLIFLFEQGSSRFGGTYEF